MKIQEVLVNANKKQKINKITKKPPEQGGF
jgi:hypothetical protein